MSDDAALRLIVDLVQAINEAEGDDTPDWVAEVQSQAIAWLAERGVDWRNPGWETTPDRVWREEREIAREQQRRAKARELAELEEKVARLRAELSD